MQLDNIPPVARHSDEKVSNSLSYSMDITHRELWREHNTCTQPQSNRSENCSGEPYKKTWNFSLETKGERDNKGSLCGNWAENSTFIHYISVPGCQNFAFSQRKKSFFFLSCSLHPPSWVPTIALNVFLYSRSSLSHLITYIISNTYT